MPSGNLPRTEARSGAGSRPYDHFMQWHPALKDAERIEQAHDSEPARCYALVLEELARTVFLNETLGEPSACAAEKRFAAIDAGEGRAPRRRLHRMRRILTPLPAART
jgi:hypothetical protein